MNCFICSVKSKKSQGNDNTAENYDDNEMIFMYGNNDDFVDDNSNKCDNINYDNYRIFQNIEMIG